jgi:hypothetical protein
MTVRRRSIASWAMAHFHQIRRHGFRKDDQPAIGEQVVTVGDAGAEALEVSIIVTVAGPIAGLKNHLPAQVCGIVGQMLRIYGNTSFVFFKGGLEEPNLHSRTYLICGLGKVKNVISERWFSVVAFSLTDG